MDGEHTPDREPERGDDVFIGDVSEGAEGWEPPGGWTSREPSPTAPSWAEPSSSRPSASQPPASQPPAEPSPAAPSSDEQQDTERLALGPAAGAWPPPPPPPGSLHLPSPTGSWGGPGGWGPPPTAPATGWSAPPAGQEPPAPRRRGRTAVAAVLACLLLLGGGVGIGWGIGHRATDSTSTITEAPITPVPQKSTSGNGSSRNLSTGQITRRVDPAIVDISTVIGQFNGRPPQGEAAGTGMILTRNGEVLTNNHVVAGATSIRVTVQGRSGSFPATVVGVDPTDDVALLQVQGLTGLPTVTLADSSSISVGQRVLAIGNALGRGGFPTVTEGSVSALHRDIVVSDDRGGTEHLTDLIQTDAPIQPGDSGGALVNGSGQVVGMITAARRGAPDQVDGQVGYAIPVNGAVGVVNQIRAGHESRTIILGQPGFLGVEVQSLTAQRAAQLGFGVTRGALVAGVIPGTPAANAGITGPSVITAVNGRTITSTDELGPAIYTHKPGERIRVTWVSRSGTHTATVTLIAGPAV